MVVHVMRRRLSALICVVGLLYCGSVYSDWPPTIPSGPTETPAPSKPIPKGPVISGAIELGPPIAPLVPSAEPDCDVEAGQTIVASLRLKLPIGRSGKSAVAFSPDGRLLAASGDENAVLLLELKTAKPLHTLTGHAEEVTALAFSPDGKLLASAGDRQICVWNAAAGSQQHAINTSDPVKAMRFTPDGQLLAIRTPNAVELWDAVSGDRRAIYPVTPCGLDTGLAISPDGSLMATMAGDTAVVVLETATGKRRLTLEGRTRLFGGMAFSPDGKTLVTHDGVADGMLHFWDVETGRERLSTEIGYGGVGEIVFSPSGKTIVTGGRRIRFFGSELGEEMGGIRGWFIGARSLTLSPDGLMLAAATARQRAVLLWDLQWTQETFTWQREDGRCSVVAGSPDGKTLAMDGPDKTIELFDADTGELLKTLQGAERETWPVAFLPDGQTLASAAAGGELLLWDVATGNVKAKIDASVSSDQPVVFSADGKVFAVGGYGEIEVWSVAGKKQRTLQGHKGWVSALAFSPDNQTLVSGGSDAMVGIWDWTSGTTRHVLQAHEGEVTSVAFSPDGKLLLTTGGSEDPVVRFWNPASGKELLALEGHTAAILLAAFGPDGKTVISASTDRTIRLWDTDSGNPINVVHGGADSGGTVWNFGTMAAFGQGTKLVSIERFDTIKTWDVAKMLKPPHSARTDVAKSPPPVKRVQHYAPVVCCLADFVDGIWHAVFSPDGKRMASAGSDDRVRIWDPASGELLDTLRGHGDDVDCVSFSPDGKTLVSGGSDQTLRWWDVETSQCTKVVKAHTDWSDGVKCVAFSPDGTLLASAGRSMILWDAVTREKKRTLIRSVDGTEALILAPDGKTLIESTGDINALVFTRDGQTLISAGRDGHVRFWDVATGEISRDLDLGAPVDTLALSPDGKLLATGEGGDFSEKHLCLWDVDSGKLVRTVAKVPGYYVGAMAFSPDGKLFVAAVSAVVGNASVVRVWDAATGRELRNLILSGTHGLGTLAFSPDGAVLAVDGGSNETVQFWSVADLLDDSLQNAIGPLIRCGGKALQGKNMLYLRLEIKGRKSIAALTHLKEIERPISLILSNVESLTDEQLQMLTRCRNIRSLSLSGEGFLTDDIMAHLAELTDIEGLVLYSPGNLTDTGLAQLKGLVKLRQLGLGGMRISAEGLTTLKDFPALESLGLGGEELDADALNNLSGLTRLKKLSLTGMMLRGNQLAPLKSLTQLEKLSLAGCQIGIGNDALADLASLPALTELNLSRAFVSDYGLVHLKNLTNLTRLDITWSHVTDRGMAHLAALVHMRDLNLEGAELTDAGIVHLMGMTKLQRLSLEDTKITDAGLLQLKVLVNLKKLELDGTRVTVRGRNQLAEALPKLDIDILISRRDRRADSPWIPLAPRWWQEPPR